MLERPFSILMVNRLFSQKRVEILFLFLLGVLPLLWLRPGYFIAKGDEFPLWLNPDKMSKADVYLWDVHNMGNVITMPFIPYGLIWLSLMYFGFDVGLVQILIQVFLFVAGGLAMYHLSRTIYARLSLSPLISSVFYMFNFFVLQSRLSIGMAWTYAFLPLLMALLITIVQRSLDQNNKTTNRNIVYFAIVSSITFSVAVINPSNVILILLVLGTTLLYYVMTQRNQIRQLLPGIAKLTILSALLSLWWMIPIFNQYLWSTFTLSPEISVTAWSWTHARASFLNLFRLNGQWGWLPEYIPYYHSYSDPLLLILTFIPFLLAAIALLFKTNKSRFNAYLMLVILLFLFLAKGTHEPLSQLNLLLYTYIPGMTMFREPVSKFTMALMPFFALLIGYAGHNISHIKIGKHKPTRLTKIPLVALFVLVFVVSTYPLVTNPIETETPQIPYSSYVRIPGYWYEATGWLDSQCGDYRVLITPPDDFYMMPYAWGYYGTDGFITRIIQKPILSYYFGYEINPDISTTLQRFYSTIKNNKTSEFRVFLDLLNVKFILQRNDIQYNFTDRDIIPPNKMQIFLTQQPYIHLARKFGNLDIYEYDQPKPYSYILSSTTLKQTTIKIENATLLGLSWSFTSTADVQDWQNATNPNQWQINYTITQDNDSLESQLWNSTWGWKTINSPLLPAQDEGTYHIEADIEGQNAHQVHMKMAEYDTNKKGLTATYTAFVNDGTFNWTHVAFNFEPTSNATKYLQIQIWHGHETDKPFPNIIWVDNVKINGYTIRLNTTGFNLIFNNSTENHPATILSYAKVNPTKITAIINATEPFTLAVSEAFDESWTAYVNGKQYKPVPLYLGLKGFSIDQTGLLEVTIEYEPQRWFFYGSIISATTFLACITYLTYSYTRNKGILKQIKTTLKHNKPKTKPETDKATQTQETKVKN
jgi:hypothetical protein